MGQDSAEDSAVVVPVRKYPVTRLQKEIPPDSHLKWFKTEHIYENRPKPFL
jgi:hypothetical protein